MVAWVYKKVVYNIVYAFAYVAGFILIALMALTVCDVIGRYIFNHPIAGTYEITELAQCTLVSLVFAYTAIYSRHVTITIFSLGGRKQEAVNCFTYIICAVIVAMLSWQSFLYGMKIWGSGIVSGIICIPIPPFFFVLSFGSAMFCLVLLAKIVEFARKALGI